MKFFRWPLAIAYSPKDGFTEAFPYPRSNIVSVPPQRGCICESTDNAPKHLLLYESQWMQLMNREKIDLQRWYPSWFCPLLADCEERQNQCVYHAHKLGLCRLLAFYVTHRPSQKILKEKFNVLAHGALGCGMSHKGCAMFCMEFITPYISKNELTGMLEDDFAFLPGWQGRLSHFANLLNGVQDAVLSPTWEILYLGHFPHWAYPYTGLSIWKVQSTMTHAYITNRRGLKRIVEEYDYLKLATEKREVAIDDWFCSALEQYACYPQFVAQHSNASQNKNIFKQPGLFDFFMHLDWTRVQCNALLTLGAPTADFIMLAEIPFLITVALFLVISLLIASSRWAHSRYFANSSCVDKVSEATEDGGGAALPVDVAG